MPSMYLALPARVKAHPQPKPAQERAPKLSPEEEAVAAKLGHGLIEGQGLAHGGRVHTEMLLATAAAPTTSTLMIFQMPRS